MDESPFDALPAHLQPQALAVHEHALQLQRAYVREQQSAPDAPRRELERRALAAFWSALQQATPRRRSVAIELCVLGAAADARVTLAAMIAACRATLAMLAEDRSSAAHTHGLRTIESATLILEARRARDVREREPRELDAELFAVDTLRSRSPSEGAPSFVFAWTEHLASAALALQRGDERSVRACAEPLGEALDPLVLPGAMSSERARATREATAQAVFDVVPSLQSADPIDALSRLRALRAPREVARATAADSIPADPAAWNSAVERWRSAPPLTVRAGRLEIQLGRAERDEARARWQIDCVYDYGEAESVTLYDIAMLAAPIAFDAPLPPWLDEASRARTEGRVRLVHVPIGRDPTEAFAAEERRFREELGALLEAQINASEEGTTRWMEPVIERFIDGYRARPFAWLMSDELVIRPG